MLINIETEHKTTEYFGEFQEIFNYSKIKVFDDAGYPASVQGKPAPCMDAVNFTPRG